MNDLRGPFGWRVALVGLSLGLSTSLLSSCTLPSFFACSDDEQCGEGQCVDGACAFPDDDCESGLAYGALAPEELAGTCVEDGVADESETSGDGDGDATGDGDGDGDGDPTGDGDGDSGQPNGASCSADDECQSGKCYLIPILGGECGECNTDADCPDGGCSPHRPFVDDQGSTCNLGEAGAGCESDAACAGGRTCQVVAPAFGLRGCSSCANDMDCIGQDLCVPQVDLGDFSGALVCSPPGTLANDSYCEPLGNGSEACTTACGDVDVLGQATIGACGECSDLVACPMGQTCVAGSLEQDSGALSGSLCQ